MKYRVEKALHEAIRDLPEAAKAEQALDRGLLTPLEAMRMIVTAWEAESERAKKRKPDGVQKAPEDDIII